MTKKELRHYMKEKLPELKQGSPGAILAHSKPWANARTIGLYSSIRDEVPTDSLTINQPDKIFYFPAITSPIDKAMDFVPMQDEWEAGPYGIPQPPITTPARKLDLLIVPGLAFDRAGTRLGYGGGFYDRFLDAHPGFAATILGLCYSGQVLKSIPAEAWDIKVNGICTEKGILWL